MDKHREGISQFRLIRTRLKNIGYILFLLSTLLFLIKPLGGQETAPPKHTVHQLIAPTNDTKIPHPIPNFRWTPPVRWSLRNPVEYHIQIARDVKFRNIIDEDRIAGTIHWYVPSAPLPPGTYHWRVAVIGPDGQRFPWSPAPAFRIKRPETFHIKKEASFKRIQQVIQNAAEQSPARVLFEPATYHLTSEQAKAVIDLKKVSNLRINGKGARIVLQSPTPMVQLTECQNIFVSGFTFTYEPPMYTAGRVKQVNKEDGTFNARILPDHSLPGNVSAFSDVHNAFLVDPAEHFTVKKNTPLLFPLKRFRRLQNRMHHFVLQKKEQAQYVEPGDVYVLVPRRGKGGKRFDASGSSDIVWHNITIHGAPNECLSSFYTERLALLNVRLKRRSDRVITANNGGNNHHNARTGPWIENCLFENTGDDICHVNGYVMGISKQPAPDRLRFSLHQPYDQYDKQAQLGVRPGDVLQFYNREDGKKKGRRTVTNVAVRKNSVEVQLNNPIKSINPGRLRGGRGQNRGITRVFNLSRGCNQFVFRNNTARFGRRIGVLAKGEGGLIENNVFRALGGGGVELWNAPFEGFGASNYVIRQNTFLNNGRLKRHDAPIWITGFHPGRDAIHQNLFIHKNIIRASPLPAMDISETDSALLWKNRIELPSEKASSEDAIKLENNRRIIKKDNVIK